MTVVEGLRRTRTASGISLRELGTRTGIAVPNLSTIEHARRNPTSTVIDRVAAALGVTLIPAHTGGRSTVAEASDQLRHALAAGDTRRAYRIAIQVADDLRTAPPFTRALLAAEAATTTGSAWDALLAAITEWRLQQAGIPAPDWTAERPGDPEHPWSPPDALLPARPEHVAEPFLRRGIFLEEHEFAST